MCQLGKFLEIWEFEAWGRWCLRKRGWYTSIRVHSLYQPFSPGWSLFSGGQLKFQGFPGPTWRLLKNMRWLNSGIQTRWMTHLQNVFGARMPLLFPHFMVSIWFCKEVRVSLSDSIYLWEAYYEKEVVAERGETNGTSFLFFSIKRQSNSFLHWSAHRRAFLERYKLTLCL